MSGLLCKILNHRVQRGWRTELLRFEVFTYERWTHVCRRCGRVLASEWESVTREDAA